MPAALAWSRAGGGGPPPACWAPPAGHVTGGVTQPTAGEAGGLCHQSRNQVLQFMFRNKISACAPASNLRLTSDTAALQAHRARSGSQGRWEHLIVFY